MQWWSSVVEFLQHSSIVDAEKSAREVMQVTQSRHKHKKQIHVDFVYSWGGGGVEATAVLCRCGPCTCFFRQPDPWHFFFLSFFVDPVPSVEPGVLGITKGDYKAHYDWLLLLFFHCPADFLPISVWCMYRAHTFPIAFVFFISCFSSLYRAST